MDFDRYRGGNKQGWLKTKMDFDKCGGWNKRGGWNIFMKSINVEGGFFLRRVEFFKIGKRGLHIYYRDESTQFQIGF